MSLEALTILSLRSWCSSSSSRKLSNMGVYSFRTRGVLGPLLLALPLKSLFWPGIFDRASGMGLLSPCFSAVVRTGWCRTRRWRFGEAEAVCCWVRTSSYQVQGSRVLYQPTLHPTPPPRQPGPCPPPWFTQQGSSSKTGSPLLTGTLETTRLGKMLVQASPFPFSLMMEGRPIAG